MPSLVRRFDVERRPFVVDLPLSIGNPRNFLMRIASASILLLSLYSIICISTCTAQEEENVLLVFDASGSMWGQVEGRTKIEIARQVVTNLIDTWPVSRSIGLIAYGHRTKGDCGDIEILVPPGPLDKASFLSSVTAINPKGKTPLSAAVQKAAEALRYTEEKATVVLISDGIETCQLDPCSVGESLEKQGIDFTTHVIGFDVTSSEDQNGLRCLAAKTGGQFFEARNAKELQDALSAAVAAPTPVPPTPTLAPTPKREIKGEILAPETALAGTEISIKVSAPQGVEGYVYLYQVGAERYSTYVKTSLVGALEFKVNDMRLPAVPGEYELRWQSDATTVIAKRGITLINAEKMIIAADTALAGSKLPVQVAAPPGLDGYVYLFRSGAKKYATYSTVRTDNQNQYIVLDIELPGIPGTYELRWISKDDQVYASKQLVLTDAEKKIETADEAFAGTALSVSLVAPPGLGGYLYLYAAGSDKYITYSTVRTNNQNKYTLEKLRLPARPGEYDLKWLADDKSVFAEKRITLLDAPKSISTADSAIAGTSLKVMLSGPPGLEGYVYLYRRGADSYITYVTVRTNAQNQYSLESVRLPSTAGEYELRWVSRSKELFAQKTIALTESEKSIVAPDEAPAGSALPLAVKAPAGLEGNIYLYLIGSDSYVTYKAIKSDRLNNYKISDLNLPPTPGEYELRWLSRWDEVMAVKKLRITEVRD